MEKSNQSFFDYYLSFYSGLTIEAITLFSSELKSILISSPSFKAPCSNNSAKLSSICF